jgi:hypothetical protein
MDGTEYYLATPGAGQSATQAQGSLVYGGPAGGEVGTTPRPVRVQSTAEAVIELSEYLDESAGGQSLVNISRAELMNRLQRAITTADVILNMGRPPQTSPVASLVNLARTDKAEGTNQAASAVIELDKIVSGNVLNTARQEYAQMQPPGSTAAIVLDVTVHSATQPVLLICQLKVTFGTGPSEIRFEIS